MFLRSTNGLARALEAGSSDGIPDTTPTLEERVRFSCVTREASSMDGDDTGRLSTDRRALQRR